MALTLPKRVAEGELEVVGLVGARGVKVFGNSIVGDVGVHG